MRSCWNKHSTVTPNQSLTHRVSLSNACMVRSKVIASSLIATLLCCLSHRFHCLSQSPWKFPAVRQILSEIRWHSDVVEISKAMSHRITSDLTLVSSEVNLCFVIRAEHLYSIRKRVRDTVQSEISIILGHQRSEERCQKTIDSVLGPGMACPEDKLKAKEPIHKRIKVP